jgi:hypothetical protein
MSAPMPLKLLRSDDDLPVALMFVAMAALALVTPPQSDTWFHLRAGQEIWNSGSLITHERFSYTTAGRPWQNHEWLSQVLMYAVYAAGGPILLTLLAGGAAFLAVLWSFRLVRGSFETRLLLLLSLLVLTPPEWAVRPQALSLLIFMLSLHLVLRDRLGWMPPLIAIWANAHGVVLFGVLLAGVNLIEALVWSHRGRSRALFIAGLCAAAPMASPLGWQYWPRVMQTVSEARALGIHEYRSGFEFAAVPFWALLLALAAAAAWRARDFPRLDRADRILALAAAVLGLASAVSIRNAPFFALVAAPALSRLVVMRSTVPVVRPAGRATMSLLAASAAAAAVFVLYEWRDQGTHLGWTPVTSAAASAVRACPAPIFNTYAEGGALTWFVPEQPVFVDGRVEVYPVRFLEESRRVESSGDYTGLFDRYGIRCAVVGNGSAIDVRLRSDPGMRESFRDASLSVFVRRN